MKIRSAPLKIKTELGLPVSFLGDVTSRLDEDTLIVEHHF